MPFAMHATSVWGVSGCKRLNSCKCRPCLKCLMHARPQIGTECAALMVEPMGGGA